MWPLHQYDLFRDFPGGSVLKNSPSSAGEVVRSLVRERSHMLWSNEGQAATPEPVPSRAHCCDEGSCLPQ